ncbi:MAG: hypothetical protein ACW99H_05640, partial [Candidatus Thorarchaeota archaeon]
TSNLWNGEMPKWCQTLLSVRGCFVNCKKGKSWDDVAKRRRSEQSRQNTRVLATCGMVCCWGITLVTLSFSLAITPEYYQAIPVEWTQFYTPIIVLFIFSSIAVTVLYLALGVVHRKHPLD